MKRRFLAMLLLSTGACSAESVEVKEVDQTFTAQMAAQTLDAALPNSNQFKIHAVCGPSTGSGLYADDNYKSFQQDGISEGRLVFFSGADDSGPNVFFRDAGGQYLSALNDGGNVEMLGPDKNIWIVSYPATGVVEVHNLMRQNGRLYDLWTANKPALSLWDASAKVFTATCFRP